MAETLQRESRVRKTLLNARVNLIFYLISLFVSFFSRKVFLAFLGDNFVGLSSTLQNILGFLNLAELGIGTAIGYVLYRPLFEHNRLKINEIISVMGYLYRIIGLVILTIGFILSLFLPLIFPLKDTGIELSLVYFAYYSFLASSLIGYFINYRQNLLAADQKNYIIAAYYQTATIFKTIIQIIAAYYTRNMYLWVIIELSYGIIYSIILNHKINETYPWLKSDIASGKLLLKKYPEVSKYIKQLFVHKIGAFIEYQSMPTLIYSVVSLKSVVLYTNYSLLIDKLNSVVGSMFVGFEAGIGNLIAEGNKGKIFKVFWEINAMRYYIAGIVVFLLFHLINPFIIWWIGEEYLLPPAIVYVLLAYTYLRISNGYNLSFVYGYGLFSDIWAPIAEVIIMLGFSILFGIKYGLIGVLIGPFASFLLIICIWKPLFLYRKGFKTNSATYWFGVFKYIAVYVISFCASNAIISAIPHSVSDGNIIDLLIYALLCSIIITIILSLLMFFFTNGFKTLSYRVYGLIRKS